jgi:hypothetical protein
MSAHKATFARDKKKGGYLIRVEGPQAAAFAGRNVPVTLKSGQKNSETLDELIWSGKDTETGANVALYSFVPKPKEEMEEIPFE